MKLTVHKDPKFTEAEIIINCSELDVRLGHLIKYIQQYTYIFQAKTETGVCLVPAEDIFYIDSVDGKTFFYLKDKVYGCKESLYEFENELKNSTFVRISKNCILNTAYLQSVNPLWNQRLEATLSNGEKLIITRHYIENLKEKIASWRNSL